MDAADSFRLTSPPPLDFMIGIGPSVPELAASPPLWTIMGPKMPGKTKRKFFLAFSASTFIV